MFVVGEDFIAVRLIVKSRSAVVVCEDAIAVRLSVKSRSAVVVGEDANNGNALIVKRV